MHIYVSYVSIVLAVPLASLAAQGTWSTIAGGAVPPAASPALVFDSARAVSVLAVQNGAEAQFWERNGGSWIVRANGGTRYSNYHRGAAFDANRNVTVYHSGGFDGGSGDLAEWNGAILSPLTAPAVLYRTRHALAFDATSAVTVMFGGQHYVQGSYSFHQDTWTWDGTTWTQRFPLSFPAVRAGHAMAYDSARGRIVLFGGCTAPTSTGTAPRTVFYGDTWEWTGTNWLERTPQTGASPRARHEHAMAYDPTRQVTYVFGGLDSDGIPLNDLWAWNGLRWTQILTAQAPSRRFDCAMAFDSARGKLVLFGGNNATWEYFKQNYLQAPYLRDTWEFDPGMPGTFSTFGTGCGGSRGALALRLQGAPPTAGQTLRIQIDNLPLTGGVFTFLGASNTQYGTLPLPFPLDLLGMTGCTLLVSGDSLSTTQNVLGTALWSAEVPGGAGGAILYLQAFAVDPPTNAMGLTASPGARLSIGH